MTLLVGFDSAWSPTNSGALVGAYQLNDGTFQDLGVPLIVTYREAEATIQKWQAELMPAATIIMLDQPTIVANATGQRPVENIVGSAVSLRFGGMQPASTSRRDLFGNDAPVWTFLKRFGGVADPRAVVGDERVFETYPVLTMIALGWMLPDARVAGRLPKYNPQRRKTFMISDWQHVCGLASVALQEYGLSVLAHWLSTAGHNPLPRKSDQDGLDACLCLLAALHLADGRDCLLVGDLNTGYIVVPNGGALRLELDARCTRTGRVPSEWVNTFRLSKASTATVVDSKLS